MDGSPPTTLDAILAAVRARFEADGAAHRARVRELHDALNDYECVARQVPLHEAVTALGLDAGPRPDRAGAAARFVRLVEALPEFSVGGYQGGTATATHVPYAPPAPPTAPQPAAPAAQPAYARLAALGRPVVFYGGEVDPPRLAAIKRLAPGVAVEWTEGGGPRIVTALAEHIRRGTYGAVVPLYGMIGHAPHDLIKAACADAGVPICSIAQPGTREVHGAFAAFEDTLRRKEGAA